jgi:hypothetical protein
MKHLKNKLKQHRNSLKNSDRNSKTIPYWGGETVPPSPSRVHLTPPHPLPSQHRSALRRCANVARLATTED